MECPAAMQAMPDDSRHLGVPIPPTKTHRQGEGERDVKVGKEGKNEGNDNTDEFKSSYRLCNILCISKETNQ